MSGGAATEEWQTVRRKNTRKSVSFAEAPKPSAPRWISTGRLFVVALIVVPSSASSSAIRSPRRSSPSREAEGAQTSFDSFARLKQEGKCFRCFHSGHLGFQCRSRQRCFKCRGVGHLGIDCTSSPIQHGQSFVSLISSSALCNNSLSSMSNKPACRPSLLPTPSSLSSPPFRGIKRQAQAGKQIASAEATIAARTSMADRVLVTSSCPTLAPRIAELII
ncbi:hypothetical protein Cni_G25106 [Canna indica]|uniref:CCHC-type domain-containing protein n=1 Tax=Canna indica TaxID=4628 RepID=A0AAQ3QM14_9LILI|nr:hypothetical protein Cni_G25106 [Canna indica]